MKPYNYIPKYSNCFELKGDTTSGSKKTTRQHFKNELDFEIVDYYHGDTYLEQSDFWNKQDICDVCIPEYENGVTSDEVVSVLKFIEQLNQFYKEQEIINNINNNFACDWKENGYKEKCKTECDWCKHWNNYLNE